MNRKIALWTLAILVVFAAGAMGAFSLEQWEHFKPVTGVAGPEGYALLPLDLGVYDQARDDLSDLRILDGKGREVPYQILDPEEAVQTAYPAVIINQGFKKGEYTTLTVDMGKDGVVKNTLTLSVEGHNFLRTVSLEGSSDQKEWVVVSSSRLIFAVDEGVSARKTEITFDDNNFRFLRIRIDDGREPPLEISGVEVAKRSVPAARAKRAGTLKESGVDGDSSYAVFDLGAKIPSDRVVLETGEGNYHRRVMAEGSNDLKEWRWLGKGAVYRYRLGGVTETCNQLDYTEASFRYLKISFANGDNEPVKMEGAVVYTRERPLLVEYTGEDGYRLYFGNPAAVTPKYDLAHFAGLVDKKVLPVLSLGKTQANPEYQPPKKPWTEERPWLLWGVLGLAVVVLGRLILKTMAKV